MARKAAFAAAALIVLAAIVYSAVWWIVAERLREGLDGWAADMRARGWSVSYDGFRIEGYPGPIVPVIDAPSVAAPGASGGWQWRGPRLTGRVWPWHPTRIAFAAPGEHRIRPGGGAAPIVARPGVASGSSQRPAGETRLTLALRDIAVRARDPNLPRAIAEADVTIALPDRPGRADRGRGPEPPGPTVTLRLAGIDIPGRGAEIDELSLAAKLIGPVPRAATASALAVWRDAGGVLEIGEAALRAERASARGSGTVALDRDLQPIAAMSLRIEGHADLLRLLLDLGAVEQRNAGAVNLGLQLLAGASKGSETGLPVTIQNRRLYLGPLSVMRLPRIDWGG